MQFRIVHYLLQVDALMQYDSRTRFIEKLHIRRNK